MNKYYVLTLFLAFSITQPVNTDAKSIKKCISTDGEITYARSCPSDTEESETLKLKRSEFHHLQTKSNSDAESEESNDEIVSTAVLHDESVETSSDTESTSGGGAAGGGSTGGGSTSSGVGGGRRGNDNVADDDGIVSDSSTSEPEESISESSPETITSTSESEESISESSSETTSSTSEFSEEELTTKEPTVSEESLALSETETLLSQSSSDSSPESSSSDPASSASGAEVVSIEVSEGFFSGLLGGPKYSVKRITKDSAAGQIIIDGSGFSSGPNVILYDRFDNGIKDEEIPIAHRKNIACDTNTSRLENPDADKGPLIGCWTSSSLYYKPKYHNIAHSGNSSMSVFNGQRAQTFIKKLDDITEIYVSLWAHVPPGKSFPGKWTSSGGVPIPGQFSSDSSWKFTWVHDGKTTDGVADVCTPTHVGNGQFLIAGNDKNILNLGSGDTFWSWNNWTRMSTWMRANESDPLGPGNTIFQAVSLDKGFFQSENTASIFDEDGPFPKKFKQITVPGWIRTRTADTKSIVGLYDDIYIAVGPNSVSRVELGDSENYFSSKKIVIQPAIEWKDNQIKISTSSAAYTSFTGPAFLYLTDNDGVVNKTGFPIP